MTQGTFLMAILLYAAAAPAAAMNSVQASPEVGRADLNITPPRDAAVDVAWRSTFMVLINKPNDRVEYASAFVIANILEHGQRRLQLVTSDHALASSCDERHCRGVEIHEAGRVTRDPRSNERQRASASLDVSRLTVLRRDAGLDLAVVQITVDAAVNPRPLGIARRAPVAGDRAYLVGYPNVFKGRADVSVDQPDVLARRWSTGLVLGFGTMNRDHDFTPSNDPGDLISLSVPALGGNSGGPLVNAEGHVIGVFDAAAIRAGAAVAGVAVNLNDLRAFLNM